MGIGLGIYVEKDRRIYATGFTRGRELTALPELCAPKLYTLPAFLIDHMLAEYERRQPLQWLGEATIDARAWLTATTDKFVRRKVNVAFDIEETELKAERMAYLSRREKTLPLIKRFADFAGLALPKGNRLSTPRTIANRCYVPKVWRRIIEVSNTRESENCLREVGFIERRSHLYCSDLALSWHRSKMRAQKAYLQNHSAVSTEGEQLNLWEVRERSVSNPALRRAELMTRMRGFEETARELGHVAEFVTLTCPSAFHSMLSAGGANPEYKGFSVRDGQRWLSKMWARSRSKFKRKSMLVYGFRVAEPHHDGTPHWHMVLFCPSHQVEALRLVLKSHWLSEYAHERGGEAHRIEFKTIDPALGSATGYISKYVAKNIDGFEVGRDYESIEAPSELAAGGRTEAAEPQGNRERPSDATQTSARVRAWASLHGIRQFQQVGGPPVGIYRELRRVRTALSVARIESARSAADAGEFAKFIAALGGIAIGRARYLNIWTKQTEKKNGYDEARGPQIKGIVAASGERLRTREKLWTIERIQGEASGGAGQSFSQAARGLAPLPSLGPVSITVRGASAIGEPSAWTNSQETSMYGPVVWQDTAANRAKLYAAWRADDEKRLN